jgi:hypothetical protein
MMGLQELHGVTSQKMTVFVVKICFLGNKYAVCNQAIQKWPLRPKWGEWSGMTPRVMRQETDTRRYDRLERLEEHYT